jgi:hypothetical protein
MFLNAYSTITLLKEKTKIKMSRTSKGEIKSSIQLFFNINKLIECNNELTQKQVIALVTVMN